MAGALRVLGWWLLMHGAYGLQRVLVWGLYVPMRALAALCDGRDAAEVGWLLACSQRRLDRRRRVNVQEVDDGQRG
jgi:hypothetical protein